MPALTRAKNGDWFARKVIPADVRDAYQRAYGVRQEERFRLTTDKSTGEAKGAFAEWVADVEGRIAALRSAASGEALELSHRQVHELVGRWYDWFVLQHSTDDAPAEVWDRHYERYELALSRFGDARGNQDHDGPEEGRGPAHAAYVRATVQELSLLPTFLAGEGIALSQASHAALVDALERDLVAAMALLRRRAGGDYRPDKHRDRFPQATHVVPANVKLTGWNAWQAFEAWVTERKPAVATVNRWRAVFMDLNAFLENRDIALMTEDDAVAWKDKLTSRDIGGRTINEIWLTGARTVFNWVRKQKKLTANPLDGVKVAVARSGPTRGKFQEEDAQAILSATIKPLGPRTSDHLRLAVRWVPWLCAYTGARSGEMTQLRKQDIEQHRDGFWVVHITPDAGTVKGSMPRTVVLHDHLIEQGFIEFVQEAKAGPLFYDPGAVKADKPVDPLNPPRPPYVLVRQKLADWVRKLGVTDPGVGPNHGWRHTFRRRAAKAKIEERIRDAFCGHTDPKVARRYELPDIEELAEAIKGFPRYPVDTRKLP